MTNRVLKSIDVTLLTKVSLVKAKAFPVVMYGCESWTKKKIEHPRTDAFQLWCSKRLMTVQWTARRFNQSILSKISSEHSLERLTLALKLQYFGHRIWRADSLEKTWMLGKVEVWSRRKWQRMRWLDGITNKLWEMVKDREACHAAVNGVVKSQTHPSDWTSSLRSKAPPLRKISLFPQLLHILFEQSYIIHSWGFGVSLKTIYTKFSYENF